MNLKPIVGILHLVVCILALTISQMVGALNLPPQPSLCPGPPALPCCPLVPKGCPCKDCGGTPTPSTDISILSITPEDGSLVETNSPIVGATIDFIENNHQARVTLKIDNLSPLTGVYDESGKFLGKEFSLSEGTHEVTVEAKLIDISGSVVDSDSKTWSFDIDIPTVPEDPPVIPPQDPPSIVVTDLFPLSGTEFVDQTMIPVEARVLFDELDFLSFYSFRMAAVSLLIDGDRKVTKQSSNSPITIVDQFQLEAGVHEITIQATLFNLFGQVGAVDTRTSVVTVSIPPVLLEVSAAADAYVRTDLDVRRNDNYGQQEFIMVGTGRGGDGKPFGSADAMRSLIRFDLSRVPPVRLTSALLELTLHSFDGIPSSSVFELPPTFTVDVHRILDSSTLTPWVEGNGFEGDASPRPPMSTDPDTAFGVAWEGSDANNFDQPLFAEEVTASLLVEDVFFSGDPAGQVVHINVTDLVQDWLDGIASNQGLLLRDVTSEGYFRGIRFGAREGGLYGVPGAVTGPRLLLAWNTGAMIGDITGDDCVDRTDLDLMLAIIREQVSVGPDMNVDYNDDGWVNIADARFIVTRFTNPRGASCP